MSETKQLFFRIAGICSIIAPLVMLTADLLQISGFTFEFTIFSWLSFVFFVPVIFGLAYLLTSIGSRLAIYGGASAFFGAMAGAAMQVLFRVYAVLDEKNSLQAIELLKGTTKLVAATQMIGIFFPIGLLTLAFCLYKNRVVSFIAVLALAAGAILFPVGRIGGFWWAFIGSDIFFIIAFVLIGRRFLSANTEIQND